MNILVPLGKCSESKTGYGSTPVRLDASTF